VPIIACLISTNACAYASSAVDVPIIIGAVVKDDMDIVIIAKDNIPWIIWLIKEKTYDNYSYFDILV
jgi:hypothetical protein